MINNPHYQKVIDSYDHLKGVGMTDNDPKPHLILGASEYAVNKTTDWPRVGLPGEQVAEKTKLGWTIMPQGAEIDHKNMLLTQTSHVNFAELCRLDILGLEDSPEQDQRVVYAEFREQLVGDPEGWYETSLPWKGNHPPLPDNKAVRLRRLGNLHNRLERMGLTKSYTDIIESPVEYLGSHMRFHPVLIAGDLRQDFLQVRIKKEERDALRFHWKRANILKMKHCVLPGN